MKCQAITIAAVLPDIGTRQMDIMTAVAREQVEVSVATTQSRLCVRHGAVNQYDCRADESPMLVHYKAVNLAMALTNCCNEVVTKLWNH